MERCWINDKRVWLLRIMAAIVLSWPAGQAGSDPKQLNMPVHQIIRIRDRGTIAVKPYYSWLSAHEIVVLRIRKQSGYWGGANGQYHSGSGFEFSILDTTTGRETPLESLNQKLLGTGKRNIGTWNLSPDGRWLLWTEFRDRRAELVAASLDGEHTARWPRPEGDDSGELDRPWLAWLPDSTQIVALLQRKRHLDALITAIADAGSVRQIGNIHDVPFVEPSAELYSGYSLLGVSRKSEAIAYLWHHEFEEHVHLFTFALNSESVAKPDTVIALPKGTNLQIIGPSIVLSPQSDRLVWELSAHRNPNKDEIWVSRLNGYGMHKVGEMDNTSLFGEDEHHIEGMAWTPDGSRITFIYKGQLWAIDAR